MLFSKPLLHPDTIEAKSIFSSDLMTLWEMVDLLVLIETLIQVALARGRRPENIPLVRLCRSEPGCLKHRSNELVIESQHLVQELTVLDMITFLVSVKLHIVGDHLLISNVLENEEVRLVLIVEVVALRRVGSVEETVGASMGSAH